MNSNTSPAPVQFAGFYAEMASGFVRVINENKAAKFKADGTVGHAYKVQPITLVQVGGWSGGSPRQVRNHGEAYWVKAGRVFNLGVKFSE